MGSSQLDYQDDGRIPTVRRPGGCKADLACYPAPPAISAADRLAIGDVGLTGHHGWSGQSARDGACQYVEENHHATHSL